MPNYVLIKNEISSGGVVLQWDIDLVNELYVSATDFFNQI